ncbi:DUF6945 domain-containing protein [Serratia plymuthica]|uniref:DUF6945 domain-containing protein n=1 Tax=Serratia plymuthica TaxID=82996 RepID=UPI003DA4575E
MNIEKEKSSIGYINGAKHKYASLEKILISTTSITRLSDNLRLDIDPYDKLVYLTMRDSFQGYKSVGLSYYEDQVDIAAAAGVSVSKLKKSIKKWSSMGLIDVLTIRTALGNKSNSYIVISFSDVSERYQLDCEERFQQKIERARPILKIVPAPQAAEIPGINTVEPDYFSDWDDTYNYATSSDDIAF